MHPHPARRTVRRCPAILPPVLLRAVVEHGTGEQRERALRTLALDAALREARQVAPLPRVPPGAAGEREPPGPRRTVSDAGGTRGLPGRTVRSEGGLPTGDPAARRGLRRARGDVRAVGAGLRPGQPGRRGAAAARRRPLRARLRQRLLGRPADGVRRRRRGAVRPLHRLPGRDRPRARARRHRGGGRAGLRGPVRRAQRARQRRLRQPRPPAPARADGRRGRLAHRRRPAAARCRRRGPALDGSPRHGVRRPGARPGPAAGVDVGLRRHRGRQRRRAPQLRHPQPRLLPRRDRARRARVGGRRAGLVRRPALPRPRARRRLRRLRGPDRRGGRPVRRGRAGAHRLAHGGGRARR